SGGRSSRNRATSGRCRCWTARAPGRPADSASSARPLRGPRDGPALRGGRASRRSGRSSGRRGYCPRRRTGGGSQLFSSQVEGELAGGEDRDQSHHEVRIQRGIEPVLELPAGRKAPPAAHLLQRLEELLRAAMVEGALEPERLVDGLLLLLMVVV